MMAGAAAVEYGQGGTAGRYPSKDDVPPDRAARHSRDVKARGDINDSARQQGCVVLRLIGDIRSEDITR